MLREHCREAILGSHHYLRHLPFGVWKSQVAGIKAWLPEEAQHALWRFCQELFGFGPLDADIVCTKVPGGPARRQVAQSCKIHPVL